MGYDGSKSFKNLITTIYMAGYGSHKDLALNAIPMSLLRSGNYNYSFGTVDITGANGYYWSRYSGSNNGAYDLFFRPTVIYPQNSNARGYGWSLRCLAR